MFRALVVGLLVSVCSALVGVPLVLRKNSMLGDGLSHTAFSAFALATVFGFTPLWFALPITILASFFILRLSKNGGGKTRKISGDSAIALLSASSLALGTFAISLSKGINIDLNSYLFGSILSVSEADVAISIALTLTVIVLFVLTFHRIFAITFDEAFARSIGVRTDVYDVIFAIICSVTVTLGMRLLGSLLISSLIIFPTVIAMSFAKTFKGTTILAVLISIVTFVVGLVLSFLLATPAGATIVLVNLAVLLLARALQKILTF